MNREERRIWDNVATGGIVALVGAAGRKGVSRAIDEASAEDGLSVEQWLTKRAFALADAYIAARRQVAGMSVRPRTPRTRKSADGEGRTKVFGGRQAVVSSESEASARPRPQRPQKGVQGVRKNEFADELIGRASEYESDSAEGSDR